VAATPWWQGAMVYRLDPARFQDSGAVGRGDLAGIIQRMDYLQSLGVDALLLDDVHPADPAFEDLIRSASQHHLRLLLTVTPAMQRGDPQAALGTVHGWLSAGIAGVYLPQTEVGGVERENSAFPGELAALLRSFPGGRMLLTGNAATVPARSLPRRTASPAFLAGGPGGVWTLRADLPGNQPDASAARAALVAISTPPSPGTVSLLSFAGDPPTISANAVAEAALLLTSRSGALFDFGDEIGLATNTVPPSAKEARTVMQWTPTNIQGPEPAPIERVSPAKPDDGAIYGPYRPYVHPPPTRLTGSPPAAPHVTVDGNIPAALPDPDTLPGFTTGHLPAAPVDGDRVNVAVEERDPHSILNAYRQLIALHHGNPTLRDGAETVLNRDGQNAVVWIRRAPAGSRTAADVVGAVNLGDAPVVLTLDADLAAIGMGRGPLRPLFTFGARPMTGETTHELRLPPHGVFLGEVTRRR